MLQNRGVHLLIKIKRRENRAIAGSKRQKVGAAQTPGEPVRPPNAFDWGGRRGNQQRDVNEKRQKTEVGRTSGTRKGKTKDRKGGKQPHHNKREIPKPTLEKGGEKKTKKLHRAEENQTERKNAAPGQQPQRTPPAKNERSKNKEEKRDKDGFSQRGLKEKKCWESGPGNVGRPLEKPAREVRIRHGTKWRHTQKWTTGLPSTRVKLGLTAGGKKNSRQPTPVGGGKRR